MTWRSLGDSNPCFRRERAKLAWNTFWSRMIFTRTFVRLRGLERT